MSWRCWFGIHTWKKGPIFSQFLGHMLLCQRCDEKSWEWYR